MRVYRPQPARVFHRNEGAVGAARRLRRRLKADIDHHAIGGREDLDRLEPTLLLRDGGEVEAIPGDPAVGAVATAVLTEAALALDAPSCRCSHLGHQEAVGSGERQAEVGLYDHLSKTGHCAGWRR